MRVLFDRGGAGAVERKRAMAVQADLIAGLAELGVVVRAVHIVATEAGDAATVHDALHEIISLHTIFVGCAVGEMREGGLAELMFLKHPIILQV